MNSFFNLSVELQVTNHLLERIAAALETIAAAYAPLPVPGPRKSTLADLHFVGGSERLKEEKRKWNELGVSEDEVETMGRV